MLGRKRDFFKRFAQERFAAQLSSKDRSRKAPQPESAAPTSENEESYLAPESPTTHVDATSLSSKEIPRPVYDAGETIAPIESNSAELEASQQKSEIVVDDDSNDESGAETAAFGIYKGKGRAEEELESIATDDQVVEGTGSEEVESKNQEKAKTPVTSFWDLAYEQLSKVDKSRAILEDHDIIVERVKQLGDGNIALDEANPVTDEKYGETKPEARQITFVGKEAAMKAFVSDRMKQMETKEWVVRWKGKEVFNVRRSIHQVVKIVQKFSGLASQAASLDLLHAGLAWAGVCCVLPLIISDTEERQKAIDGVSSVAQVTARYMMVEQDYFQKNLGQNKDFEEVMISRYKEIVKFYAKAARYFARKTLARWLLNVVKADDWTSALKSITSADEECRKFANNQYLSVILHGQAETIRILQSIQSVVAEQHLADMLRWISKIDIGAQHDFVRDKLQEKYFVYISGFVELSEPERALVWIIIEHLRRQQEDVVFFYCNATLQSPQAEHKPTIAILRVLAKQLSVSSDRKCIAEEVTIQYEKLNNPGPTGSQLGDSEVSKLLISLIDSRSKIIVLVDALDECPEYIKLLVLLRHLSQKTAKLKFFFSSQLVVPVNEYFPTIRTITINPEGDLPSPNKDDIEFFVAEEVRKFAEDRPDVLTEDMCKDIIKTLPEKAGAMFKLAELSLKYILDSQAQETRTKIKGHLELIKNRHTHSVFGSLIRVYEDLFNKHLPSDEAKRSDAIVTADKILSWIFVSLRPLRRDEAILLADDHFDPEGASGGIDVVVRSFIFESEAHAIQIPHSSVWDYLAVRLSNKVMEFTKSVTTADQEATLDEAWNVAKERAHTRVTQDSIEYLLSTNHVTITGTEPKSTITLLEYIAENWFKHAKVAKGFTDLTENLTKSISQLFEKKNERAFRNCVQLYDPDSWFYKFAKNYEKDYDPTLGRGQQLYYAISIGFPQLAGNIVDLRSEETIEKEVNAIGGFFGTPLQLASYKGYRELVAKLLSKGSRPNIEAGFFGTPLEAAAAAGNLHICVDLFQHDADVNFQGGVLGSAFQAALAKKSDNVVELLLNSGARVDKVHGAMWTRAFERLSSSAKKTYIRMMIKIGNGFHYPDLTIEQEILAIVLRISRGDEFPFAFEDLKALRSSRAVLPDNNLRRHLVKVLQLDFLPRNINIANHLKFFELLASRRAMIEQIIERLEIGDIHTIGFVSARLPWVAILRILELLPFLTDQDPAERVRLFELCFYLLDTMRITRYEDYFKEATLTGENQLVESVLVQLYEAILQLVLAIHDRCSKSRLTRALSTTSNSPGFEGTYPRT
ncbi:uncharacterized protein LY89DRAFT_775974 [Mollisia scopiformis]|uniref:Uncharacterized protein n=1 Tax=Mollisia scopiformis TaxID=149040 RepID=A0A194XUK1_MOLSC|nr:uncharacterized protein LY89DRAFT_775974 [Mollisia scopiformis]KUJ23714.1 hypothetical protein LY89DRAFT_775974 [Mollisia scopiformis]